MNPKHVSRAVSFHAVVFLMVAATAINLLICSELRAQADTYWNVASGDWSGAGNWTAGVPGVSSNAWINNGGTVYITQPGETSDTLTLGNAAAESGTVQMTSGALSVTWENWGVYGTGTFTQSGGTNASSLDLNLGDYSGSSGTYVLSDGSLTVGGWERVGVAGVGTFIQTGGTQTVTNAGLVIPNSEGGSGSYTLSGGLLSDPHYFGVGPFGTGTFTQSGGTNTLAQGLDIGGQQPGYYGNGAYTLSGNGSLSVSGYADVGDWCIGSFSQSGGTASFLGGLTLAANSGSSGTYNLNGGQMIVASITQGSGTATFNFNGGTMTASASFATNQPIGFNTSGGSATIDNGGNTVTLSGVLSGPGGLTSTGSGTLNLTAANTYSGGTNINQGTLNVTGSLSGGGNVVVANNAVLSGSGLVLGNISGAVASTITASGNMVLGNSTSYTGFNQAGTLIIGSNTVTLNSAGFANLGVLTTLGGGTITAPNGVTIPLGGNLVGSGAVNGKIAAGYGSTINATGNLTLGDSTSPVGFVSDGELYTNANTVTLNSSNAANNKNAVVLGSLTEIDGGSLVAPNGILLNSGNNLVTTNAGGTVSGGVASRFLNLGNVQGPSSASSDWLTFEVLFKGGTGLTSGRIAFLGGFATGDSPGVNTQYGATELGGTGTEFDIGGPTPGDTDNNYGQLNILTDPNDPSNHGDLTLLLGTSFRIVDWNAFVPAVGETFTVLTWDGALSGTASLAVDPAFAADGIQFLPEWNSNSLVLQAEAVPEPSTLVLLAAGALGLAGYGWRTRRKQ